MAFKYGDGLRFRKDISLVTWVSGIHPKGQLGHTQDHVAISLNDAKLIIPMDLATELFELDLPEHIEPEKQELDHIEEVLEKPKKEPKTKPTIMKQKPTIKRVRRKKQDA
jgi:hypothetical protein